MTALLQDPCCGHGFGPPAAQLSIGALDDLPAAAAHAQAIDAGRAPARGVLASHPIFMLMLRLMLLASVPGA